MGKMAMGLVLLAAVLAGCSSDSGSTTADAGATIGAADNGTAASEPTDDGGAGDASSEPDDPPDAGSVCDLATDGEISAIVGNEVIGVEIDATLCEYSLVSGVPASDGTTVDVFMNAASEESCELEFGLVGAADGQPVDGIGNAAYWATGSPTAQLAICTGSSFLTITQYKPPAVTDDEALARAQGVADIVLGRL